MASARKENSREELSYSFGNEQSPFLQKYQSAAVEGNRMEGSNSLFGGLGRHAFMNKYGEL